MLFSVPFYECESRTMKQDMKHREAFEIWCWQKKKYEYHGQQGKQANGSFNKLKLNL